MVTLVALMLFSSAGDLAHPDRRTSSTCRPSSTGSARATSSRSISARRLEADDQAARHPALRHLSDADRAGAGHRRARSSCSRTVFGRHIYAVGTNAEGGGDLRRAGAPRRSSLVFVFAGFCAAVAAILYSARLEGGRPTIGAGSALLDIIGATVIGGTSLAGGKGKVTWTFVGVRLLRAALATRSTTWASRPSTSTWSRAAIILAAAALDVARTRLLAREAAHERRHPRARRHRQGLLRRPRPPRRRRSRSARGRVLGLSARTAPARSTLMNIIGGVVRAGCRRRCGSTARPTRPQTRATRQRSGIAFIHQELNLFTNLTIAENIFIDRLPARRLGPLALIDRARAARRTARAAGSRSTSTSPPETPVERLSPGERQLVEVAKALQLDAAHHHLRRADHLADRTRDRAPVRADRPAARRPASR